MSYLSASEQNDLKQLYDQVMRKVLGSDPKVSGKLVNGGLDHSRSEHGQLLEALACCCGEVFGEQFILVGVTMNGGTSIYMVDKTGTDDSKLSDAVSLVEAIWKDVILKTAEMAPEARKSLRIPDRIWEAIAKYDIERLDTMDGMTAELRQVAQDLLCEDGDNLDKDDQCSEGSDEENGGDLGEKQVVGVETEGEEIEEKEDNDEAKAQGEALNALILLEDAMEKAKGSLTKERVLEFYRHLPALYRWYKESSESGEGMSAMTKACAHR